jgi:signal peptidase I
MIKEKYKIWINPLIFAVIAAIIARIFVQSYVMTDSRMRETVKVGDYIIIDRTAYGLRLPITFFSLPVNNNKIPFTDIQSYVIITTFPYKRIGFREPDRLDVIAYNFPMADELPIDLRPVKVSRLVALPGDTLAIVNKKVFVNNKLLDRDISNLMFEYRIVTDGTFFKKDFLDSLEIEGKMISDMGVYDFYMTPTVAAYFETLPHVKYVREVTGYKGYNALHYFPANSNYFGWNKDYFGPLIIPFKGYTVNITYQNIDLYKRIIRAYEDNDLFIDIYKKKVFINGEEAKSYTFKKNYYFVMDDNRDNAFDSRYFGFIPEDHIIGKAKFVWFSIENKNGKSDINWSRMLKKIE